MFVAANVRSIDRFAAKIGSVESQASQPSPNAIAPKIDRSGAITRGSSIGVRTARRILNAINAASVINPAAKKAVLALPESIKPCPKFVVLPSADSQPLPHDHMPVIG